MDRAEFFTEFLRHPVLRLKRIDKVACGNGKYEFHHVLHFDTDDGYYELIMKPVARVTYEGEIYLILLPVERETLSAIPYEMPTDAAYLYRVSADGLTYERVLDYVRSGAVFEMYRKLYPAPHVEDALKYLDAYIAQNAQELRFEYVDEPKDGVILLKNPDGSELTFNVIGSVAYQGSLYLLLMIEDRIGDAFGESNGAFIFRCGKGSPLTELFLITDGELCEAVLAAYNNLMSE